MKDFIKRIFSFLASLWNIYAGIVLSTMISIFVKWIPSKLDTATSYILLTLTCITVFTYIKKTLRRNGFSKGKNKSSLADTIDVLTIKTTTPTKRLNTIDNLEADGKYLGETIVKSYDYAKIIGGKSMKAIANFFKWLKNYWQQWLDYIAVFVETCFYVYTIVLDKLGFIKTYIPDTKYWQLGFKIGMGIIVVLFAILHLRNTSVWRGVGSNAKAEALKSQALESATNLSPENKKVIKDLISVVTTAIKSTKKAISVATDNVSKFTAELNNQKGLITALSIAGVTGEVLNDGVAKRDEISSNLNKANEELKSLEAKLTDLNAKLESYNKALNV